MKNSKNNYLKMSKNEILLCIYDISNIITNCFSPKKRKLEEKSHEWYKDDENWDLGSNERIFFDHSFKRTSVRRKIEMNLLRRNEECEFLMLNK